jgi:hypothetical protein
MATSKNRTLRVRILVKAFPQPSKAHEETVCCAGINEDGTELLRLFPIGFRRLPKEHQFDRFDLVQMTATKASDPRPESYRVDEASIRLIERSTLTDGAKVRIWQPFHRNVLEATARGRPQHQPQPRHHSPRPGQHQGYGRACQGRQRRRSRSCRTSPSDAADAGSRCRKPTVSTSAATAPMHSITSPGETMPARNLHFIMGTMAAHPRTFIVIGLLRSGLDRAELAKQVKLF